jgi:hypothetical protein
MELGRGGQIGEGSGQVGASARPQPCAARRPYHRHPESVELHLVPAASRARRVLRDRVCRSSKGEVHWSRESGRKGSRSGHASRMRECAVGAWPDLRVRARSKWVRTHSGGPARRRRAVHHALEMIRRKCVHHARCAHITFAGRIIEPGVIVAASAEPASDQPTPTSTPTSRSRRKPSPSPPPPTPGPGDTAQPTKSSHSSTACDYAEALHDTRSPQIALLGIVTVSA